MAGLIVSLNREKAGEDTDADKKHKKNRKTKDQHKKWNSPGNY